jgi:hypothetical protein
MHGAFTRAVAYARPPMGSDEPGPWQPLGLEEVVRLFSRLPSRWWISGGHALELHAGRSWRGHEDTDVSVLRQDSATLREALGDWDIHVASDGTLSPWTGSTALAEANQNNLWCRRSADRPWCLDVTIGDGNEDVWIYRRDPSLRVRWGDAVLRSEEGIPYLAPELQLLFKSKNVRPKDDLDAAEVVPALSEARRLRLRQLLPEDHPWQVLCASVGSIPNPGRGRGTSIKRRTGRS